jgi:hypothetical protein
MKTLERGIAVRWQTIRASILPDYKWCDRIPAWFCDGERRSCHWSNVEKLAA